MHNMASIRELADRTLAQVTEALVFAADRPVTARDIAGAYSNVTGNAAPADAQVLEAVADLNEAYAAEGRVFRIERWAAGFRMATIASVAPYLKSFFDRERVQKMSRSLMETLAIVAYRQPVTKPEVDFVRGVDSGYALGKLMEQGFVDVAGRSDSLGRPLIYATTSAFLEQFGLGDLDELPTLREIEEILGDPAFSRERAELLQLQQEGEVGQEQDEEAGTGEAASTGEATPEAGE